MLKCHTPIYAHVTLSKSWSTGSAGTTTGSTWQAPPKKKHQTRSKLDLRDILVLAVFLVLILRCRPKTNNPYVDANKHDQEEHLASWRPNPRRVNSLILLLARYQSQGLRNPFGGAFGPSTCKTLFLERQAYRKQKWITQPSHHIHQAHTPNLHRSRHHMALQETPGMAEQETFQKDLKRKDSLFRLRLIPSRSSLDWFWIKGLTLASFDFDSFYGSM